MKALVIFLNCYILMLSVLSCKDNDEIVLPIQGPKIELSQHTEAKHSDDFCTPFCTCACCGTNRTASEFVQLATMLKSSLPIRYSALKISLPGDISLSFWQPPQVA